MITEDTQHLALQYFSRLPEINLPNLKMKAFAIFLGILALALEANAITCTPNTPPCSQLCSPTDYLCCGASYVSEHYS